MQLKGNVLITGGAGFLGQGIISIAREFGWDCKITVYSRDEEKQWRLRHKYPEVSCILGDVRDPDGLLSACAGRDVVIHAAAVKFVPEAEYNVLETVAVNVNGTRNVALACERGGVGVAVFVSTDKACLPVNLYGATKMVGEKIWSDLGLKSTTTKFVTARYGNVIGSTGSLVPLFQRQLATKGRVSVTNPAMTRFFMTYDDALGCILSAMTQQSGVIVGAKCQKKSIGDIAAMVAGAAVDIIGARPGEKVHETLLHDYEAVRSYWVDDEGLGHFGIVPSVAITDEPHQHPFSSDTAPSMSDVDFLHAMAAAEDLLA